MCPPGGRGEKRIAASIIIHYGQEKRERGGAARQREGGERASEREREEREIGGREGGERGERG